MHPMNRSPVARLAAAGLFAAMAFAGAAQAQTPSFTAEQAKRGAELYTGACALCRSSSAVARPLGPTRFATGSTAFSPCTTGRAISHGRSATAGPLAT